MNKPEYVKVDGIKYKINTDFRVAIECNKIALDSNIGDYERALAIIYNLYGEKGLNCKNIEKLFELTIQYLNVNNEGAVSSLKKDDKYELDFEKCKGLIRSSFKFDYNYDPYEMSYLHWWDFYNDLQNLSTSEFGNCCILNRITSILNQEPREIKDDKQRRKVVDAQKELKRKYCIDKEVILSKEQEESAEQLYKALGIVKS